MRRAVLVPLLVILIVAIASAGFFTYGYLTKPQAEVAFRELPCASIAKPDKVVELSGFTFNIFIPLTHEGFLNMSIEEKAKHFPHYVWTYCMQLMNERENYLENHPEVNQKFYAVFQELNNLAKNPTFSEVFNQLEIGKFYDLDTSSIYIGVPRTVDKNALSEIIPELRKIAEAYGMNIYLYNITCDMKDWEGIFGDKSSEEIEELLKSIGVDDFGASGPNTYTGRIEFIINASVTSLNDPRIMHTVAELSKILSQDTPCREIDVVFIPYFKGS